MEINLNNKNKTAPYSLISVCILIFICIYSNSISIPNNILSWDVFGYYLYLPLFFIYHDIQLSDFSIIQDIAETYKSSSTLYQTHLLSNGNHGLKYSMGIAILYLPFFIIGHVIAIFTEFPADGFSLPYQYSIWIGSIIVTIIGLLILRKILLEYFEDYIVSITLAIVFLGTNFFNHTSFVGNNAMSHNYLFTTYVIIIFYTIKWHKSKKLIHLKLLAIICGLTILSRPSEVICLFIPFLWNTNNLSSLNEKIKDQLKNKKELYIFALIILAIGSLQLSYWMYTANKIIYYTYGNKGGEGFDFLSPHTFDFLFSFRKGWIVYTPIMVLSLMGFYFLRKQYPKQFLPLFIYFILNLYIVSSWSCWWYAGSFSQRSLIQSYAVLSFPLAAFLTYVYNKNIYIKSLITTVILLLISLNLFQTYQVRNGILHNSRMTKDYYLAIFGKTKVDEKTRKLLLVDRTYTGKNEVPDLSNYRKKSLINENFESSDFENISNYHSYSKDHSLELVKEIENALEYIFPYKKLTEKDHLWIHASAMVYSLNDTLKNNASLIIKLKHGRHSYKNKSLLFEDIDIKPKQWTEINFYYLTPEIRQTSDMVTIYLRNRGIENIFIDDFKVDYYERLPIQ